MATITNRPRRAKLKWCAEHNTQMSSYINTSVQYLIKMMPNLCNSFSNDMSRISDNLNQYLSSENAGYWSTRREHIDELCAAVSLPLEIWNLSDFSEFKEEAQAEYQRQGIFIEPVTSSGESMFSLVRQLHKLPYEDGATAIKIILEQYDATLGFRRKKVKDSSKELILRDNDSVRIEYYSAQAGYAVLFLIDELYDCRMLAPGPLKPDTKTNDKVLHIPEPDEEPLDPPAKHGRHLFYAFTSHQRLTALHSLPEDEPLSPETFSQLLGFCREAMGMGVTLYRLDFWVTGKQ